MIGRRLNARIHTELDKLVDREILAPEQARLLKEGYPTTAWDWMALVRLFTVLGAATAILGGVLLLSEPLAALIRLLRERLNWWLVAELGLGGLGVALLTLGRWLRGRKALPSTGEVVQLVGCVALQGLIFVLAAHHASGSDNWPALVGIQTVMIVAVAYLATNRLALWYGCIHLFFWLGAQTGYAAGWGCYWLGMTYPVRYLAAGVATLALSWAHGAVVRGQWAVFSRIYAHFGLLAINLSLWFLSLFGYYEDYEFDWSEKAWERFGFTMLWGALSAASVFGGARYGIRLLRAYGLTFGILNLYTFYFQFVAANTAALWHLHLMLSGGSLLALGVYIERHRAIRPGTPERSRRAGVLESDHPTRPSP